MNAVICCLSSTTVTSNPTDDDDADDDDDYLNTVLHGFIDTQNTTTIKHHQYNLQQQKTGGRDKEVEQ